jgi:hypothetical protein
VLPDAQEKFKVAANAAQDFEGQNAGPGFLGPRRIDDADEEVKEDLELGIEGFVELLHEQESDAHEAGHSREGSRSF